MNKLIRLNGDNGCGKTHLIGLLMDYQKIISQLLTSVLIEIQDLAKKMT